MNRLIIIGNGFDLAHGLPTGYCDFINWFWSNLQERYKEPFYSDILYIDEKYLNHIYNDCSIACYADLINYIKKNYGEYVNSNGKLEVYYTSAGIKILKFNNSFFEVINNKSHIQNWVDIENEYYRLLKNCIDDENNDKVKQLNEEFEQVKNLLEEYLVTQVEQKFEINPSNKVLEIFEKMTYSLDEIKEFPSKFLDKQKINKNHSIRLNQSLLLSFNYTSLSDSYSNKYYFNSQQLNQIHGRLNSSINPIIFGFGDEMHEDYKKIENKDDNEYLHNIKSFSYLNTSNYKNLIDFLELDDYEIYIIGHSCGLSDRILLNKVFEHHNCISIKIYYYEKDGWDNYTDIAQNISRHFNKKEMMRERIVNKTYCEPLPQMQLPLKE